MIMDLKSVSEWMYPKVTRCTSSQGGPGWRYLSAGRNLPGQLYGLSGPDQRGAGSDRPGRDGAAGEIRPKVHGPPTSARVCGTTPEKKWNHMFKLSTAHSANGFVCVFHRSLCWGLKSILDMNILRVFIFSDTDVRLTTWSLSHFDVLTDTVLHEAGPPASIPFILVV